MPRRVSIRGKGADLFFGDERSPSPLTQTPEQPKHLGHDEPDERQPNGRGNDRSNARLARRSTVRHAFDVYRDQLYRLAQLQMTAYRRTGSKPTLGSLVREALDIFLERSTVRTTDRTSSTGQEEGRT